MILRRFFNEKYSKYLAEINYLQNLIFFCLNIEIELLYVDKFESTADIVCAKYLQSIWSDLPMSSLNPTILGK